MFRFAKELEIKILPLGATEPFIPDSTISAVSYLRAQLKMVNSQDFKVASLRAYQRSQGEKITNYIKLFDDVDAVSINGESLRVERAVSKLKHALSDPQRLWLSVDVASWQIISDDEESFQELLKCEIDFLLIERSKSERLYASSMLEPEKKKLQDFLNQCISDQSNIWKNFSDKSSEIDALLQLARAKSDDLTAEAASKIEATNQDLEAFKQRIEAAIQLSDAKNLWLEKASRHKRTAVLTFTLFCTIIFAVFISVLFINSSATLGNFERLIMVKTPSGESVGANYAGIALMTFFGAVFLWPLRHISRMFLDNLEQMKDAQQRHAMLKTYLSIVGAQGVGVTKEERVLALNALFRPASQSGSEDSLPTSVTEYLTKLIDSREKAK